MVNLLSKRISYVVLALVFVLAFAAPSMAGTQELIPPHTDSSSDASVPVTDHLMITISSNAVQGGNDATEASVDILGAVEATEESLEKFAEIYGKDWVRDQIALIAQ